LQKLKGEAIKADDFLKAAEIKKEIDLRESDQKKIKELQLELDKKIKEEDYLGSAEINKQIKIINENKIKKAELRKKIDAAVAIDDFQNAAKYKAELDELSIDNTIGKTAEENSKSISKSGKPQGAFEGKIVREISFENIPYHLRGENSSYKVIEYYKGNKRRHEKYTSNIEYNTNVLDIIIVNCETGEELDMCERRIIEGPGKNWNHATIKKIPTDPSATEKVVYEDEFKTILGYNCQKAKYTYRSKTISFQLNSFVCLGFSTSGYECQKNPFILVEWVTGGISGDWKIISIEEIPLNDELFSTVPPKDYILTDKRKQ
jgi:hypothetical protein